MTDKAVTAVCPNAQLSRKLEAWLLLLRIKPALMFNSCSAATFELAVVSPRRSLGLNYGS